MKLIIDIPDNVYEFVMNTGTFGIYRFNTAKAIKNGTPLDDVKAEIEQIKSHSARFRTSDGTVVYVDSHNVLEVLDNILDNIGKAESED